MKRLILLVVIFSAFALAGLLASDFGAFIAGDFEAAGADEKNTSGSINVVPWLSVPFGRSELYISAGLNASFADKAVFAPELFRLELSSRLSSLFSFKIGRITWQDPSGFIAKGRFDGADFLFSPGKVKFGVNALYTGFLFKDSSEINISPADAVFLGIEDGEFIECFNDRGSAVAKAAIHAGMRPGMLSYPKGLQSLQYKGGHFATLSHSEQDPLASNQSFFDCGVDVRKWKG